MKAQQGEEWQDPASAVDGPETLYQCCHLERDTPSPEWKILQKSRISGLLCLKNRVQPSLVLGLTLDTRGPPLGTGSCQLLAMAPLLEQPGWDRELLSTVWGWAELWAGLCSSQEVPGMCFHLCAAQTAPRNEILPDVKVTAETSGSHRAPLGQEA